MRRERERERDLKYIYTFSIFHLSTVIVCQYRTCRTLFKERERERERERKNVKSIVHRDASSLQDVERSSSEFG